MCDEIIEKNKELKACIELTDKLRDDVKEKCVLYRVRRSLQRNGSLLQKGKYWVKNRRSS